MPERLTLAPGVEVPAPEDGSVLRYSGEAVQDVLDFFSLLCFAQNEWAGKPFELLPWEEEAVRQFYGIQVQDEDGLWVRYRRYLYDELPKKNGKTELAAGLGLYHLLYDGEERPRVGVFSSDKENASQIYEAAKYMVENTSLGQPEHDPIAWAVDSRKEIHTKYGGVLKVYSADAATKHGYSFSAIIIDELHAQPNRRLWDVLTAGSNAARRQQAVIVLTTAGDDPDRTSIGWEVHEKALGVWRYRRGDRDERAQDDPRWLPIIYGLGLVEDEDKLREINIFDEQLWRDCNPSVGRTLRLSAIRAEAQDAKRSEAAERLFRWLRLNQWIATASVGWIPVTIYDKTQWNPEGAAHWTDAVRLLRGKRCFGGVDLSKSTDLTAFVLVFPPQEGLPHWVALPTGWMPLDGIEAREREDHCPYRDWMRAGFLHGCEGDIIDFEAVADAVVQAAQDYDLQMVGFDPYLGATVMQNIRDRLAGTATEVVEIPQGIRTISPPMKELERLIREHEMLHVHNTAARQCFLNVRCITDDNENIKPTKKRSRGRIDMTVAWIIAFATALLTPEPTLADSVAASDWHM